MTKPILSAKLETKRFGKFLKRYVQKQLPENAEAAVIRIALLVLRKVILKNPVDTGRSRAGWSAAGKLLGVPVPRPVPSDLTPTEKGTATLDSAGNFQASIKLTNGVEYSVNLERGTSTQAPFGMVRISMREVESELGGQDALPREIRQIYAETWDRMGVDRGTELRARDIATAIGLSEGMNVGAA